MEPITTYTPTTDPTSNSDSAVEDRAGSSRPRFTLRRSRRDRMISGVCGGLAEATNVDAALIRLGLVALTVIGAGSGILVYVAAWILVPEADA